MSVKAQFNGGKCGVCNNKITIGDDIQNFENDWCHVGCIPKEKPKQTQKPKKQDEPGKTVKVESPSHEAEILVRYHLNRAHKIIYENIESFDSLSKDDLYSLRVKEGLITKLLLNADLKLREINGIKSKYD